MRILILGGLGMLGHRLWIELSTQHETWVTVRSAEKTVQDLPGIDREKIKEGVDATNFDEVIQVVDSIQPDVIINCIGIIKQLPLSKEPITAIGINALLPHQIARIAQATQTRMIHFSTDCVFSGTKQGVYTEEDFSDAEDLYGRTKYLGEVSLPPYALTLRTSIIGRELKEGYGLVEWFLRQRQPLQGYQKTMFSGFTTGAIARILLDHVLPNSGLTGVYHLSSSPISKYDLLLLMKHIWNLDVEINPDTSMICNRVLDSSRFRKKTGFTPPSWEEMIEGMGSDSIPYDRLKHS